MERVRLNELVGKRVLTVDGVELGDVLDVELEVSTWQVTWLFIRLDRHITDRFHVDAPYVMGTKAIALQPHHVERISQEVVLQSTLLRVVLEAVVCFPTDETQRLGRPGPHHG